jgi:hypothetical protein
VLYFTKVHPDLRLLYNFRIVHFEMLKKVFKYCSTSGSSFLGHFASGFETCIADLKQKLHNERCKLSCAKNSKAALCTKAVNAEMELVNAQADLAHVTTQNEGLKRKAHALFMCGYHAPGGLHRDAEKSQTRFLKAKGIITDSSWEMTQELVAKCSVPVTWVNKVIRAVARGFGITVKDTVDNHSVSHILLEGELALEIQLVSEMHNAGSKWCLFLLIHFYDNFPRLNY